MTRFLRRKAAVALGVLALTLAGGGIAAAQPATKAQGVLAQPGLRTGQQPPVTAESARRMQQMEESANTAAAPSGVVSFAVVNANGTLARGLDVDSVTKFGPGQYEVLFNRNVSRGGFVASIGRTDACCIPTGGEASVSARAYGLVNAVFVQTRNSAGTPVDLYFHLAVHT